MKYILTIAIATILLIILFREEQIESRQLLPQDTILAFGDSLTYGHGVEPSYSYPSILAEISGYRVINEGLSGELSSSGLQRLSTILEESSSKLLILCHGGNDIIQRRSPTKLKANLMTMIDMAHKKGMQVLLIGVPDISLIGLSIHPLYKEIAQEKKIAFVDDMLEDILSDSSLKGDRIHPNRQGYRKMAEMIYAQLLEDHILASR